MESEDRRRELEAAHPIVDESVEAGPWERPAGSVYARIAAVADITYEQAEEACEALREQAGLAVQTFGEEQRIVVALRALGLVPAPDPVAGVAAMDAELAALQAGDREVSRPDGGARCPLSRR